MVTTAKRLFFFKGREATPFALGLASAAAMIVVAISMGIGAVVTGMALLHVAALTGIAILWLRTDAATKAAEKASSDVAFLANRLVKLEKHVRAPEANPALRSTVAEVTGTVGLLGGVVRELARSVAAQNRDVADLKDTLNGGARSDGGERLSSRPAPDRHVVEALASLPDIQPEPSLLPARPQPTEDEIGRMRLATQAFEADRIELHLQPVVALPQRKIRFYEALARLRLVDGTLLGPIEFLPVLERLGRAPEFDRRMVVRAVAVARHLVARGSEAIVAVNLSPRSIREPGFLYSLARVMDDAPEIAGKVVLEIPQAAWRSLDRDQKEALAALRDRGVPFSIDRAADLAFDAPAMADLGVRFLKLPAELMIATAEKEESRGFGHDIGVRDFASVLRREGIKLVAERVEREEAVPALAELGVPLAQGFVFAAPRAIRGDVLGPSSAKTAFSADAREPVLRRAG
ncbi:EAL domain-containing protein [Microvirga sp. GCM10011540]|uniref:EAL domain-containing protein n=1 Tax=Microvirga sp. GCM10011540 TaxID=3317338 RepID=UPI0036128409